MTRVRLAAGLAVVATLAVLATAVVAITTYAGRDGAPDPGTIRPVDPVVVHDPATGASFEVPGASGWRVRGRGVRIYYADPDGRAAAVVRGPAVFRPGYCPARPEGSNRGFAGFTRQGFHAWADALARSTGSGGHWTTGVDRTDVVLPDGTAARMTTSDVFRGGGGACAAPGVAIGMVSAGGVRVVLVRDTTATGTLSDEEAAAVLTSLRLGD